MFVDASNTGRSIRKANTSQPAAWVPLMFQNPARGGKFRNSRPACSGDTNIQGFVSLLNEEIGEIIWMNRPQIRQQEK